MGEVTIVFNNAGVRLVRPFVQYTQAQIEKMISVNLMGQVCVCVYVCMRYVWWTRADHDKLTSRPFPDVGAARILAPTH